MNVIPFEPDATKQLRFDIIRLSKILKHIDDDIDAFHRVIMAFEREYHQRLGDLAEAVSVLRRQLDIETQKQAVVAKTQLADPDFAALKVAYRQAAKLCHPDYLASQHHERGLDLFDKLNKAYHLQDLVSVRDILWLLQSGQAFSQTQVVVTAPHLLQQRQILLQEMITQKKDQLAGLKMQETDDISDRDNWNGLLYDYQIQLEDELATLRAKVGGQCC